LVPLGLQKKGGAKLKRNVHPKQISGSGSGSGLIKTSVLVLFSVLGSRLALLNMMANTWFAHDWEVKHVKEPSGKKTQILIDYPFPENQPTIRFLQGKIWFSNLGQFLHHLQKTPEIWQSTAYCHSLSFKIAPNLFS
jgi:hypothetical protein